MYIAYVCLPNIVMYSRPENENVLTNFLQLIVWFEFVIQVAQRATIAHLTASHQIF